MGETVLDYASPGVITLRIRFVMWLAAPPDVVTRFMPRLGVLLVTVGTYLPDRSSVIAWIGFIVWLGCLTGTAVSFIAV